MHFTRSLSSSTVLLCLVPLIAMANPEENYSTWDAPAPEEQCLQSQGLAPANTGTLFVPKMTNSAVEPRFEVKRGDESILTGSPGTSVFLIPGEYTVSIAIGNGTPDIIHSVTIREGITTFLPTDWAVLVVTILDEKGSPFRGSYELVELPSRDYVGIGLGADLGKGEFLRAWHLRPGRYMLLTPGESYQARRNFLTVRLVPGELTNLTLIQEPTTGDFLGGGEITRAGESTELEGWDLSLILGGSFAFSASDGLVEKTDGSFLNIELFAENINTLRSGRHVVYQRTYLEESSREIELPDKPYLKDDDELEIEALYSYRTKPFFGPYVRTGLTTHILPSILVFDQPTDILRVTSDGPADAIEPNRDLLYLAPPFSNIRFRLGAGARFEGSPAPWFQSYTLFGFAARQLFTNRFFVENDDPSTPTYEIQRREDNTLAGIEGVLVLKMSMTRWILWQLEADILAPMLSLPDSSRTGEPVVGLDSNVALRLASFASLNYIFELERDPDLSARTQLEHSILLRFAYRVF